MDLSIVLPALNEAKNLAILLRFLEKMLPVLSICYEVIVVDGGSLDQTVEVSRSANLPVRVLVQEKSGYGEALRLGFSASTGDYVITLDCDLSHNPELISSLWQSRSQGEIVIASRYVAQGKVKMPFWRIFLSKALNLVLPSLLSIPVRDISSGFRLYHAPVIKNMKLTSENFEILEEILIKAYADGCKIHEIPLIFAPRKHGKSKVRFIKFALSFLKTFVKMWKLRNSTECADYDDRAFDSRIPFQRYWQRKRFAIITKMVPPTLRVLDIGCGSSRILSALPQGSVGLDILHTKLKYARKFGRALTNGTIWALPFKDEVFDCVICSEVIEHILAGEIPFYEIRRVLKRNGLLILGTPDYSHRTWRIIESIYAVIVPGGYACEHITHYTSESLQKILKKTNFNVEKIEYIFNSEMILKCRKS